MVFPNAKRAYVLVMLIGFFLRTRASLALGSFVFVFVLNVFCFAQDVTKAENPPKTLEEGNQRLSKLLGRLADPVRLNRFIIDDEIESQPDLNGPKLIIANKGQQFTTNPFVRGDSLVFSETELLVRDVFNLSNDGKRTLNRHLDRTYSMDISLTRFPSGEWVVSKRMLNHSLPRGSAFTSIGTVQWLANGMEFRTTGVDSFYSPDGTTKLATYLSVETYTTHGERLVYEEATSMYEMAKSPDGANLTIPDLKKPLGKPMTSKRIAESRQD